MKTNASTKLEETRLRAIVFDCDGVLFDSKEANVKFYSHILERVGLPPVTP